MMGSFLGFIELGGIVLAWVIVWTFLMRSFCAHHNNNPAVAGLAAAYPLV